MKKEGRTISSKGYDAMLATIHVAMIPWSQISSKVD